MQHHTVHPRTRPSAPTTLPALAGALLGLLLPVAAAAADPPPTTTDEVLDSARVSVRSTAEWLARGVDSWFGDKPFSQGGQVSDGRLSLSVLHRQDEGSSVSLRFNARFRLPNVEQRAYLFVGRDNPRELISDRPGALSRQQRLLTDPTADQRLLAGIGLTLHDAVDLRLGFRGGLKPYLQARYRSPWQLGPRDLVEFRETVFWSVADQLGSTTALSWEHAYSSTLAGRWLTATTVTQAVRRFDWSSSVGLYKSLGDQRLLSLEGLVSGQQGSGVTVGDYGLQGRWEQPIHKNWLLGELLVGHFWPRKDAASERGSVWAVGGSVKMRF